jgi:predicted permease
MTGFWQDLRIGARGLSKRPGFTVVVVLALAMGLGVNAVVFGVVNDLLVRPLPVAHPERLVSIYTGPSDDPSPRSQLAYPDYQVLRTEEAVFDGVLATHFDTHAFRIDGAPPGQSAVLLPGEVVSGNYFEVLGLRARLGRTFSPREGDDPGADPVVVISDALWKRSFGADPAVLGKKVHLNGGLLTVIGVMPPGFKGVLLLQLGADYWFPLAQRPRVEPGNDGWIHDRSRREVSVFARRRPGVTLAQSDARVELVGRTLARQYPLTNANLALHALPEIEGRFGAGYRSVRMGSLLALVLAGLVLLVCCANVANLSLARAAGRAKEVGVRLALGAGAGRIARQLLTESLLLAFLGGALALVVASWLPRLLQAFLPPVPFAPPLAVAIDGTTVLSTALAALVAGLVFGVVPAWRAGRADLMTALKSDVGAQGQRLGRGGLRHALVVAQLAVSVVVVLTAGLTVRSLRNLQAVDPGYRIDGLGSMEFNPGFFEPFAAANDPKVRSFFEQLTRRVEGLPGVRSVSSSAYLPLVNLSAPVGAVVREGEPEPPANEGRTTGFSIIHPRYFETTGSELLRGRDFLPEERTGAPATAIINAELARRLFGGVGEALGHRFRVGGPQSPFLRVVGVARDGRYRSLFEEPASWVFLPGCAPGFRCDDLTHRLVLVRAERPGDLPAILDRVRAEAATIDPRVPVDFTLAGEGHLAPHLNPPRLAAHLVSLLALLALALATLGVYSVMTYAVTQRTKEIGIRMALGSQARDVVALVVKQGLALTAVGLLVGGAGALATGHVMQSFLFGVRGADPLTFVLIVPLLVGVALLATVFPARRAARVSPLVAIRYDQNR